MKRVFLVISSLFLFALTAYSQSPVGTWKTIDDETGEEKSYVEIYEEDGKLYGKIVRLLQVAEDTTCDKCTGDKKDQPLMGMQILWTWNRTVIIGVMVGLWTLTKERPINAVFG